MKYLILLFLISTTCFAAPPYRIISDNIIIGKGNNSINKILTFNTGAGSANPQIRENFSSTKLEFTNDGSTYFPIISAASDIISLFSACSGLQYLGADGVCHNGGGHATAEVFYTSAPSCPTGSINADGTAVSRTTYANLLTADTISTTATASSGSTTITVTNATNINGLQIVEGTGIDSGTFVVSTSGTTITLNVATTGTLSSTPVMFFPYGNGDGSTTFNTPNIQAGYIRAAGSQTHAGISYSATWGITESDQLQGHAHSLTSPGGGLFSNISNQGQAWSYGGSGFQVNTDIALADDSINGTPRSGAETRPFTIIQTACVAY